MSARRRNGAARAAWLACCLLACAFPPAQALRLSADTTALAPPEAGRSQALLADAARRLPAPWSAALGDVRVEWRDDLPANVEGRAYGSGAAGRILLRRTLLSSPGDDRLPLAALLHELAHLYDRSAAGGLSRDPRLLELAGWQDAPLRPWRTRNAFTDRSPDRYELADPVEYVAVNLEHFLLDPDFACRRPALSALFAARFDAMPALPPTAACPRTLPFMQATADDGASPLRSIDPSRVYAIDYLLAEGNAEPMSRWGHAMLRIVACAPGHEPGPACRLDLAYHQVLSFRAFVDDVQISSWRGLTGAYPSRLFVLPLAQVVDEYTKVELRGLRSIPLHLSPGEIATLLQRAAQVHWSYDGRYAFVGNNCAVETARLLQDGVPRLARARLMSVTPNGLLRRLERGGIAGGEVPADRADATRLGYYFEPMSAHYQALYEVARAKTGMPERRVEAWFALPPATRAAAFASADLRAGAALLALEEAALRRQQAQARDLLKRGMPAPGREAARGLLQLEDTLTRPALLLSGSGGYGIPQQAEREAAMRDAASLSARWRDRRDALLAQAREWLPGARRDALAATEANVATLGARLRALARPSAQAAAP